jgi:hypothetical protein
MSGLSDLYGIPAAILLIASLVVAIGLAGAGQMLVHRRFKSRDFIAHNEVGGIMIVVAGTFYAVVLGFLTVVVWQHYIDARQLVVLESDAAIDAWHTSVGLPAAVRDRVRTDMVNYARIMVGKEWSLMKHGEFDSDAALVSMDAIDAAGEFVPANMGQSNAQVATMQQLGVLHDARQQRIAANDSGVSGFEWLVLLIGAVHGGHHHRGDTRAAVRVAIPFPQRCRHRAGRVEGCRRAYSSDAGGTDNEYADVMEKIRRRTSRRRVKCRTDD